MHQVEYYFSFVSLWSYIGSRAFIDIVRKHRVKVIYKPIDLLAVFAAGGGLPVDRRPLQRRIYRIVEMKRWREIRGIRLTISPKYYPADPSVGHRMLLAALEEGHDVTEFVHACLQAVWAEELDIEDRDTLRALADRSGLDGAHLLRRSGEAKFVAQTEALTKEAIDRQLFGAPFYFYRGEPFWGQDRLDLLEQAIVSGRPPILPEDPPPAGGRSELARRAAGPASG